MPRDESYRSSAEPPSLAEPTVDGERRQGPAVFDVAPIGRRRRTPDRALVLGAVAIACLALAFLKPWESPGAGASASPDAARRPDASAAPSADSVAVAPAATTPAGRPFALLAPDSLPAWTDVVAQLDRRDDWGVRFLSDIGASSAPGLVRLGDGSALVVDWVAANPEGIVRVGWAAPIRMLGVTTPYDEPPLDVRVWRQVRGTDEPVRMPVERLPGDRGTGEGLLLSADGADGEDRAWSPGTYRFELLLADRIANLDIVIPGPKLSDSTVAWTTSAQRHPDATRDAARAGPEGASVDPAAPVPVAVVGSKVVPLIVSLGPPLDERGAWLDARSGSRRPERKAIGSFAEPDVAALGVAIPAGTTVTSLTASRIGGVPEVVATRTVVDADGGRVIVLQPDETAGWLAGIYRIDVAWQDRTGRGVSAAYHIDLDTSPPIEVPRLLAAVRSWARYAGQQGIVTGIVEPLEGGPAAAAIRLLARDPGTAAETVEELGGRCRAGGALTDAAQAVLGVAHRTDQRIEAVTVERLFDRGRTLPISVRASIDPVPGLVVLTPADAAGWRVGHYRIVLRGESVELRHVVCLGPGPGARAEVPAEASSRRAYAALAGRRR